MEKFQRNYVLTVQTASERDKSGKPILNSGKVITIQPPFTLEFDIQRNILTSANTATLRIYNLSDKTRNLLLKDQSDTADYRLVILNAGYGVSKNYPIILAGNIQQCWSVREGTNFITQIEAHDGGFAFVNGKINQVFPAGTPQKEMLQGIVDSLGQYGVVRGAIGNFDGTLGRGNTVSGNALEALREMTGGAAFVDNGKLNILKDNECIAESSIAVINSAAGLLGTPVREQAYLNFDILFEPRLLIGQKIRLDSITGANYNADYKVVSLHHRGTISSAVCGDAVTSVGVFYGLKGLTSVASMTK